MESRQSLPDQLRCEYQSHPLGIDHPAPRFSWIMRDERRGARQTAFRLLVANSEEALKKDRGNMWDTGKLQSDRSTHVTYAGKALQSSQPYWWKVRVWDQDGAPSAWSRPQCFETAFLDRDEWKASWIGMVWPEEKSTDPAGEWIFPYNRIDRHEFWNRASAYHYFRKTFSAPENIDVANLTLQTDRPIRIWMNGRLILDRFDEIGRAKNIRVYDEFEAKEIPSISIDVTASLEPGDNLIAIQLFKPEQTPLAAFRAALVIKSGNAEKSIITDKSWLAVSGEDKEGGRYTGPGGWHIKNMPENWNLPEFRPPKPVLTISGGGLYAKVQKDAWFPADSSGNIYPMKNRRSPCLRKEFQVKPGMVRARLYATALGFHQIWINGQKAHHEYLSPGKGAWDGFMGRNPNYVKRLLQYQVYDVTELLDDGPNAIGAMLGNGWYNSMNVNMSYRKPALRLELELVYEDGSRERILSDDSWKASPSPVVFDNIHYGEIYDARMRQPGWARAGFDDTIWQNAENIGARYDYWNAQSQEPILISQIMPPVRTVQELQPVSIEKTAPGQYLVDFGQLISGIVRLKIKDAPAGQVLKMHYGYSSNRLNDRFGNSHEDIYICRGEEEEVWEKKFGWGTIRYARVSGYPGDLEKEDIQLLVLHNDFRKTGKFACSNDLVNELWASAVNTFRGNTHYHTYDTERERMNWGPSVLHPFRMANWAYELIGHARYQVLFQDSGEWAVPHAEDIIVAAPWNAWLFYEDLRFVDESFPKMQLLADRRLDRPDWAELWWGGLGNWKSIDQASPEAIFGQTWHYITTRWIGKLALATGREQKGQDYLARLPEIARQFNEKLIQPEVPTIAGDSQASLAMGLYLGIVPDELFPGLAERLVYTVAEADEHLRKKYSRHGDRYLWLGQHEQLRWKKNPAKYEDLREDCLESGGQSLDYHMTVGPFGCPFLFHALERIGRQDVAYRLLTQTSYPSLGYMMRSGNKAIPESYKGSNSHPAYTAFADWLYESIGGLKPDPENPGFKHFFIRPKPVGDLTWAKAEYQSIHGLIKSEWRINNGLFTLNVLVPANTSATIILPAGSPSDIREQGHPLEESEGVTDFSKEAHDVTIKVAAGQYQFSMKWDYPQNQLNRDQSKQ
ncbi:MAG: family 78 glycoside hydrolase catalytic domain [Candidatus Sumerlaeia bacterium]